jgi:ComEC/Rec2-related protein
MTVHCKGPIMKINHVTPCLRNIFPHARLLSNFPAFAGMCALSAGIPLGFFLTGSDSFACSLYLTSLKFSIVMFIGAAVSSSSRIFRGICLFAVGTLSGYLSGSEQIAVLDKLTGQASMEESRLLRGSVVSVPVMIKGKYSFIARIDSLFPGRDNQLFSGKNIMCFVDKEPPPHGCIEMKGTFKPPQKREVPGSGFDELAYYMSNNLWGKFYGKSFTIKNYRGSLLDSLASAARSLVKTSLSRIRNEEYRGVLIASFLNERDELSETMKSLFYQAGIYHLLALSGFNIAILAGVVYAILFFFPIKKEWKICIAVASAWIYLFFIGCIPSLFRAVVMTTVVGVSLLVQKRSYPLNSLGLAGIAWLVMSPASLFTPGFQLSFSATFGLITLSPLFLDHLTFSTAPGIVRPVLRFLTGAAAVSAACFIATLPILIYHFNQIYLFGLFANLFAVSLMSLSMWAACAGFAFQLIFPPLAAICMHGAEFFLLAMTWGAGLVRFIPWSTIRFAMPYAEIYVFFAVSLLGLLLIKKELRGRYCLVTLPACMLLCATCICSHGANRETRIAWLKMKNATIVAVRWPDNRAWLFDVGQDMPKPEMYGSAIFPWKNQCMGCRIDKVILPRWKQNSVHFLSPLLESEKAVNVFVCDSAYARDDDFLSFIHAYKRTVCFKQPGDTLTAADKCMCKIISRRVGSGRRESLAFLLRINKATVYIPDVNGERPEGWQFYTRTMVLGRRGNFKELL